MGLQELISKLKKWNGTEREEKKGEIKDGEIGKEGRDKEIENFWNGCEIQGMTERGRWKIREGNELEEEGKKGRTKERFRLLA